jgi:restriction system protein
VAIPTYSSLLLPLLQLAGDGEPHRTGEAITVLAEYVGLSDEDRAVFTPSGKQLKFNYRVQCAKNYLIRAGLLRSEGRGLFCITDLGVKALQQSPLHIDRAFLMQYPAFAEYITREESGPDLDPDTFEYIESEHTPKELIHVIHGGLQKELADELMEAILASSPAFFEKLVVDLLLAMGYGGSRKEAAKALGRTGDGGVDGYIQEDKLGLDVIYVQAKRWGRGQVVGRPVVQAFVGSLIGVGAKRGVLMTTSRFSQEAVTYAKSMQDHTIILIDGDQLARLMIEHDVGVGVEEVYVIKKLDRDYFDLEG